MPAEIISTALGCHIADGGNCIIQRGATPIASGMIEVIDSTSLFISPNGPATLGPFSLQSVTAAGSFAEMAWTSPTGATINALIEFADPEDLVFRFSASVPVDAPTPLGILQVNLPTVQFAKNANGFMQSWYYTYLIGSGVGLMAPGKETPFPCAWASDGANGLGLCTQSHMRRPCLFMAEWVADYVIPAQCHPLCYMQLNVIPGSTQSFDIRMRLSNNVSMANLAQDYIAAWRKIHPTLPATDGRFWVLSGPTDQSWITPDSPLGFDGQRRLDTAAGVAEYLATFAANAKAAGARGIIFDDLWGAYQGQPKLNPSYDSGPASLVACLTQLGAGLKAMGLAFGISARASDFTIEISPGVYGTNRVDPRNTSQFAELSTRLNNVLKVGVNAIYLDSTPLQSPDELTVDAVESIAQCPVFPEVTVGELAWLAGAWVLSSSFTNGLGNTQQMIQELHPGFIFLTEDDALIGYDAMGALKLTPIIGDQFFQTFYPGQSPPMVGTMQAWNAKWINAANGWK